MAVAVQGRGALWDVLSQACDDASILRPNDHAFLTFFKTAKRYLAYLTEANIARERAFNKAAGRPGDSPAA